MKTIIKSAIAAITVAAGAATTSEAQPGQLVWHFPYKGAPYATQGERVKEAAPVEMARQVMHKHHVGQVQTNKRPQVIR